MPNEKAAEPLSEEKLGSKKVCEVCGRERLNGLATIAEAMRFCDTSDPDRGYESPLCYRLGFEREKARAAILTPEVLRLIEAGRKYGESIRAFNALPFDTQGTPGRAVYQRTTELAAALLIAARALPFEKPAEPNEDHDCVNASAVDALDFAPCSECEDQAKRRKTQLPKKGGE